MFQTRVRRNDPGLAALFFITSDAPLGFRFAARSVDFTNTWVGGIDHENQLIELFIKGPILS